MVGVVDTPGYAEAVTVAGDIAYVADRASLQIVDISDPISPAILGSVTAGVSALTVAVEGAYVYFAGDETIGLHVAKRQCGP